MEPKIVTSTKGYLRIGIHHDSPERFLNICSARGIDLWDICYRENGCECSISLQDFRNLRPIARKTKTKIRIRNRYGFPFFLHKHRKQKMFFIGLATFFLILHSCSLYIWEIHIEGNQSYSDDVLLDFLKDQKVEHGIKKKQISCDAIEKALRNTYGDITWVSASISGTRLIIRIQENEDMLVFREDTDAPCDIIANEDCLITDIVTRSGTPLVKKGDVVAKGDILIASKVDITDDYGNPMSSIYVAADGDITALVAEEYEDELFFHEMKKLYTGEQMEARAVELFGKRIYLSVKSVPYEQYDMVTEKYPLHITENFYLPISWEQIRYCEYQTGELVHSPEEAETILQKNVKNFFQNLLQKGVQIIENNVKIQIDENSAKAFGKIVVNRPVGVRKDIESMAEETSDEYSRNEN